MVYSSEAAKWKAYQFSDPFAAGSFCVCNKINKTFCRPDCDARPITNLKSEIKFVKLAEEGMNFGYTPCEHCDPLNPPVIDVNLLVECVAAINKQIGFLPPLLDENEDRNNEKIKENIIESKRTNEEHILQTISGRRSSVPVVNFEGKYSKDYENASLSKNDFDHYRLVDLACRHLALAAAVSIFQPNPLNGSKSPGESPGSSNPSNKKRRRRGGVLGFKELAAKSKLSAWHFHRVFKSVTGFTPKTYGDKCWEFIKNYKGSTEFSMAQPALMSTAGSAHSSHHNSSSSEYLSSPPTSPGDSPAAKKAKTSPKAVKFELMSPAKSQDESSPFKEVFLNQPDGMGSSSTGAGAGAVPGVSGLYDQSPTMTSSIAPGSDGSMFADGSSDNASKAFDYTVPLQASFDFSMNQPMMNNNLDLFGDQNSLQFMGQDVNSTASHSRAYLVPDLSKFHPQTSTLFGHVKQNQEIDDATDTFNVNNQFNSPMMGDLSLNDPSMSAFPGVTDNDENINLMSLKSSGADLLEDSALSSLNPLNDERGLNANSFNPMGFDVDPALASLAFTPELLSTNNSI